MRSDGMDAPSAATTSAISPCGATVTGTLRIWYCQRQRPKCSPGASERLENRLMTIPTCRSRISTVPSTNGPNAITQASVNAVSTQAGASISSNVIMANITILLL